MSSILKGADKAYLREYNESEDERRLDALQDSLGSIRRATKGGKYLGDDVIQIMVEIQGFAEQLGVDLKELDYAERIFSKHPKWKIINVTKKPIEEIASEILLHLRNTHKDNK